jgi:ABC-2 type transport system permease protein
VSSSSRPGPALALDTVRSHRWGIIAWVVGGAVAMYAIALGFASEVSRFAGGARAMAASMQAGVEAMRLLRWPAERLDTLGGYLTYHNVTLFVLFLSLYAAVQGANAIRGAETSGQLEEILAAGRSRAMVIRDRAAGFALTLALVCAGLGLGLAISMAAGGEPDVGGSLLTALAGGLAALAAYGLGVLVSQLTATARAGAAVASLLLAGLYVLTNVWEELGPAGAIRFVSPFFYFNQSRALVPGHGLDIPASAALLAMTAILLGAAARAFQRRDYAAGLWARRLRPGRPVRHLQRPALRTFWGATLLRERVGLLTWAGAAAATLALMAWLEPTVADMWDEFQLTQNLIGRDPDLTVADEYLSFASQIVVPIVAAYVITQAAGWVGDLKQGRVELLLASPVSWPRLVWERLVAMLLGAGVITAGASGGLVAGAMAAGVELRWLGLLRLAADTLLLAGALGGVASLVVAWLRGAGAVTVLAILTAASYLLVYLVRLFAWPGWVVRLSVFGAYGDPYIEIPPWSGLAVLTALAVLGTLTAAAVAQRSPKTA